ncbi:DUF4838 domain-containing protein [Agrobacterium larrymoorei]|uniref:DUF4838 domain-containing protein n=1 Tax=Agrobacterium larrymoorei TaxID=160699 RepID=UPI0030C29E0A
MSCIPKIATTFLIMWSLLSPATADTAGRDRVTNGSFGTNELRPWWAKGYGTAIKAVDGSNAVSLRSGMIVQEHIPVTGGRNYRLSAKIFSDTAPANTVYVQYSFRAKEKQNGSWRGPASVSVDDRSEGKCAMTSAKRREAAAFVTGGGVGWQSHSIVFRVPEDVDQMVLYLRKTICSAGEAAFTEVSLTETDDSPTTVPDVGKNALTKQRLSPPADPVANSRQLTSQLAQPAPDDHRYRLAENGQMSMRVHVGTQEDIITLQAAADLSDFTAKLADATAPVQLSTDEAVAAEPLLVVGRKNAIAKRAFTDADFNGLGDDGFLIRTFGAHILIAGATPRGSMYGVNWFLDHKLGVRWLSPTFTYWPKTPDITLPELNERQVPRFAFREVLSVEADNKPWRQRNLMSGQSHGPSFLPTPNGIDSWNESWATRGTIFNFYELLPKKIYQATHREWYAGGQLAMMNKDMRAEMARVVVQRLRALPDYRKLWFSIHDMDWGWDMDPASRAFAAKHGGHPSAPRLDMMIEVADLVRAELPGARLAFNAYHWSFTPPEGMTVPDYILVYPMTIQVNYRDALNGQSNQKLGEDLAGWNAIAKHVLVWDHITNFAGYLQPTPNILPIGNTVKWLASLDHVEGYMGEGSFNTRGAEFAALRAWMIARLLWDPNQDPWAIITEFCEKYYGPAAPQVLDYIRLMHDKLAATDDVLSEKTTVDMEMFDADFISRADSLFDKAEKAVVGTGYAAQVHLARLPVDFVILRRQSDYLRAQHEIGFDVVATRPDRLRRFWQTIEANKIGQYMQASSVKELKSLLEMTTIEPASLPDIVRDSPQWRDIQDISFQRYAGSKSTIVSDPIASDGSAIALARSFEGWNTQLVFDKLPREGAWWVYVAVRGKGGIKGNEEIARVGSTPPMSCFTTVHNDPESGDGYRWVEAPGGPFRFTTDGRHRIYIQPRKGPDGSAVMVDRLIAVSKRVTRGVQSAIGGNCR